MDTFFKTVAVFFAILFIGTTLLAFGLYNVERSAFDANLYIQALDEENVYQRLPDLTAHALSVAAQRTQGGSVLSLFRNLSDEQWRIFVSELFPPDVLRVMAEEVVNQIMDYLNGEGDNVVLSLVNLKAHLQSAAGIDAIYGMLKTQPDCTVEQLTAMATGQADIVLCNPPETILFIDVRPIYEAQIRAAVSVIPEQLMLISPGINRTQQFRDLRFARTIMRLSPILPMLCLLMVALFAVRSFGDWLNWWGYPFLSAGLISTSLSAFSGYIAAGTFQIFIAPVLPDLIPSEIVNVFRDLTARVVRNAVEPTLLIAGIMAFIGLIMVLLAFLLRRRLHKSPQYVR
ncbi:MAG: hypothetical protein WBL25_00295 [Anaerolineales bacterium]